MPINKNFLISGRMADFVGVGNVAVSDLNDHQSVSDDVLMDLDYFALRPGMQSPGSKGR